MRMCSCKSICLVLILGILIIAGCREVPRIITGSPQRGESIVGEPTQVISRFLNAVNNRDFKTAADCWVEQSRADATNWYERRNIIPHFRGVKNEGTLVVEFGFRQCVLVDGVFDFLDKSGRQKRVAYGFRLVRMDIEWKILDDEPKNHQEARN